MDIEQIGLVDLSEANELEVATRLFPEPSTMEDGNILIQEMKINGELSPDIALIDASANTPVQFYDGEGEIIDIFYSTTDNKPVGVILMSPEGETSLKVYNPKTDGGQRGYRVTKGWTMQTIIPKGTTLRFFDYHSPKGYAEKEGDKMYGETVVSTVSDEKVLEKFQKAEKQLLDYMERL
jgi:hypothetical protein